MATGEMLTSFALSEPEAGSDAANISTEVSGFLMELNTL